MMGVLLAAKRRGFLPAVRPYAEELLPNGLYVGANVYNEILIQAEEV